MDCTDVEKSGVYFHKSIPMLHTVESRSSFLRFVEISHRFSRTVASVLSRPDPIPTVCTLIAQSLQLLLGGLRTRLLLRLSQVSPCSLLSLVVCSTLNLATLLESVEYVRITYINRSACSTYLATTSWYFQPTSWARRPTVQNLRPGLSLSTLRA